MGITSRITYPYNRVTCAQTLLLQKKDKNSSTEHWPVEKTSDCQQYRRMKNPRNSPDIGQVGNRGKKPGIGGTIGGKYPATRFEDKFRSANQIDGMSIAGGRKIAAS